MREWLWAISLSLNIVVIIGGAMCYMKVTGNDLKHLALDVTEIKENVKEIKENQEKQGNRITAVEVRCKERHSRRRKTKTK